MFVPGSRPFDLFDPDRAGRIKLYVKRVFITDDAEILPRYLRFVRGLVDSADLPLNVSREKIQESPLLAAIRKGATSRVLAELERLADKEPQAYAKIWDTFGAVLKEGIYEDFERRDALLKLARFKTTASADEWRSLKDYVAALKPNQTAIYYLAGDDIARLKSSPHLEGFRARGIEVLLLPDPVDTFWVMPGVGFDGKPFKSVTQGAADLALIPLLDAKEEPEPELRRRSRRSSPSCKRRWATAVAEVRASDRLTDSAVCLVAPDTGPDRALERILAGAGRLTVGVEADPRGQSAARTRHRARRARRRRPRFQGRCGASLVRRGAAARRRAAGGCAVVFRSARARARARRCAKLGRERLSVGYSAGVTGTRCCASWPDIAGLFVRRSDGSRSAFAPFSRK